MGTGDAGGLRRAESREWDGGCPYQGLAPFESDRSELFFGRRRAIRNLLERLGPRLTEDGCVLLVSGASGVGKSSLLRAGLMPALGEGTLPVPGSGEWPRLLITPTADPLRALAEALTETYGGPVETVYETLRDDPEAALAEAGRFVLVVDQFEELFTLVTDEQERQAYVRVLRAMAEGAPRAGVIIGVRADYWDRCAAYPQFAGAIQDGQVIVEPMAEADLRLAITGPAAAVGLEIEPGLVETILGELTAGDRYEAASLPLLSQALLNTWERRENGRLTTRGYEESGRVRDSVRRTADEVLGRLSAEDRKAALRIFRRMALITAGGRLARRRVTLAEIHAAGSAHSAERRAQVEELLSAFADRRLLTLHEDGAEIAHDALLTAWPTLRQWLEPDMTAQAVYDQLVEDATQWAENHRDPAYLYRGGRLLAVQDSRPRWDRDPGSFPPPGPTVERFVTASTGAARRAGRRRRLVMAGLAALSVLALVAAGAAVNAAGNADRQADNADRQRRLALSGELAAESEVADDPVTSALLAVTAWRIARTPDARHRMLDAAAHADRGVFAARNGSVTELLFNRDGSIIATGGDDGVVRLWDTVSHRQLGAPIVHKGNLCVLAFQAAFSPDGKVLATACFTGVLFWDVSTRRPLGGPLDAKAGVSAMTFSPDGRTLATSTPEGAVRLWDVATRRQIGADIGRPDHGSVRKAIKEVAFTPDGKRLITAGADDTARIWDIATRRQVGKALTGHTGDINGMSLSPDGSTLATISVDRTLRLWNLTTRKQIGGALRDPGGFRGIAFSPDGKRLATTGGDGLTRLWDTAGRQPVGPPLTGRRSNVARVAFSPDGRTLAAAGGDGKVWLWDPRAHRQIGTGMPATLDVVFSPDGKILAASDPVVALGTGAADRGVRFYDVATQREAGPRPRPEGDPAPDDNAVVHSIRFSRDGRTFSTASTDGTVRLWDTATRRQIGDAAQLGPNAELSPDGRLLATWVRGGSIGFWDVVGHREVGPRITVPGHTDLVPAMAFSPGGATLAVAGNDHTVRLFDVATHRQIGAPLNAGVTSFHTALTFSLDGRTLATTAEDGTVRLWDVAGQREIGAILTGHTDVVAAMAFSPDGRTLATGSADHTVRLWDVPTLRQIGPPLTGHTKNVVGVAYSPDGTTLATVSADRTLRLWNVAAPADPAATVCADAGRSFTRAEWQRYVVGEAFRQVCP
ncbi:NACHT and WD repeat domain-containing protein [Nonomuraea guangzhouensis]|uniref:AAA family ATPase n=1 Tax=Nonomuraea guangzhouensis TaxID=1291555 RepID=A0ABW4G485_9ACTN|nr:NACHT and WD repeat domain-containing protein [Nonomuraea guangzhouensis]